MAGFDDPAAYEAWYHGARGAWIGAREFSLMMHLLQPQPGASLLDVGCGSGYFSRRFAAGGLRVTGLDAAPAMLRFAHERAGGVSYVEGDGQTLPFADGCFDYCAAVTSLCFVTDPTRVLAAMWRVCRRGLVLGLLNRHSLLYVRKRGRGGYRGARWDTAVDVRRWCRWLQPPPRLQMASAIWLPGGGWLARAIEPRLPAHWLGGGFLAAALYKP